MLAGVVLRLVCGINCKQFNSANGETLNGQYRAKPYGEFSNDWDL